ncbi:MAG: NAD(P)-binding protein [Cyclobacteriaceae bacterium]|nr:NAD(P)-binding protein [Cyclobacteriaceae bacterium]
MDRRDFIQLSTMSLAALLAHGCQFDEAYEISFRNDMAVGHLVFESHQFPITKNLRTRYLIVGGGLAGLSAAYRLKDQDFHLFELSERLGGSSSASTYQQTKLCHGAHYDLSYPPYYGAQVLQMFEELGIIHFDAFSNLWQFSEKQYLIPKHRESRTFDHGLFRTNVLPDEGGKAAFLEIMHSFEGHMPMPTRLIDAKFRDLNTISFREWLKPQVQLSEAFYRALGYHMQDDYGADATRISALAGIHYFACRPYTNQPVALFSPPEGNAYFVKKIHDALPHERLHTAHLVKSVRTHQGGFLAEVVDAARKEVVRVVCDKVVYAGQKHALKHICANDHHLFEKIEYAPWVVLNVVLKATGENEAFWQNEIISEDNALLGFVDSAAQFAPAQHHRVLTVYYCFEPKDRELMSLISGRQQQFVGNTIKQLEQYFDHSFSNKIQKVVITQMGHAMPIPTPGYLFSDANAIRSHHEMVYAGVDNGRLPLLFEAVDSGIVAADLLAV